MAHEIVRDREAPLSAVIAGCGWFGGVHRDRLAHLPGVELVGVCDPDPTAMSKMLSQGTGSSTGNVVTTTSYDQLLDLAPDFVCICTPNPFHVPQILAALKRGIHVLCEKPLSLDPEEALQVVTAAGESGLLVAVSYQSRYRRAARLLKAAIDSGRCGRVTSVTLYASENWVTPNVGTWRHDPEKCPGGYFGDANGHQIDATLWMTGLHATEVRAETHGRGTPVPIYTMGEARLAGPHACPAARASFAFVGDARMWREEIAIQTEALDFVMRDGSLLFSDGSKRLEPYDGSANAPAPVESSDEPDEAFVAALRGGPAVLSPPESVLPVIRFTQAALTSARTGADWTPAG
ncbi:MAG: Gfo/Idh/MocA family oxidoreductase [Armatimonadetes bacterium]|nr:Gfo/Idh/MocA family oxidoreductase [Armatimonadota bacterium]MDE2207266.1 Gfo/Idh/MocA family oxidoreductase [Armatimonadota bacterium]